MSESNKRQNQRKRAEHIIEFYDPEGSLLMGVGHLLDLSVTGALVESALRLMPGQVVSARLRRGERPPVDLSATVIRVSGKGASLTYGLKFNRA